MRVGRLGSALGLIALLAGCGGGSGGGSVTVQPTPTPTPVPTSSPTPTPTSAASCSLRDRQLWVADQLREWYLFPETLPAALDPAGYGSVDAYIDAMTATARAQRRDRYFTYLTSIAEEDAYYASGSSAGYGFRLGVNAATRRLFVIESFEGAPALTAGIDRGAEITAIGTSAATLRSVSAIIAAEGTAGLNTALGGNAAGVTRVVSVTDGSGTRTVTLTQAEFELPPVSSRYGGRIIDDGGRKVGYVNLRSFIAPANDGLREVFGRFRAAGVSEVIVDLRYNGGGLVSVAGVFADLLGRDRLSSDVVNYLTFRPEKAEENETRFFRAEPNAVAPAKIAFIGTAGTASASELLLNAFIPYLHANVALVGSNTYGKPVGQIALDRPECDDRLRVIAFAVQNAARSAAYFDGLAGVVEKSCQASDDISYPLGDAREASTKAALDFLAGRNCTPIGGATAMSRMARETPTAAIETLAPDRPTTAQREVPGLF